MDESCKREYLMDENLDKNGSGGLSISELAEKYGIDLGANREILEAVFRGLSYSAQNKNPNSSIPTADDILSKFRQDDTSSLSSADNKVKQPEPAKTDGRRVIFDAENGLGEEFSEESTDTFSGLGSKPNQSKSPDLNKNNDIDKFIDDISGDSPDNAENASRETPVLSDARAQDGADLTSEDGWEEIGALPFADGDDSVFSEKDLGRYEDEMNRALGKKVVPRKGIRRFIYLNIPHKGDSKKELVRKSVFILSCVIIIATACYFINYWYQHYRQVENLSGLTVETSSEEESGEDLEASWAAIKALYPDVDFPDGMNIAYAYLYAQNQELVGYLYIENTGISTPIVQSAQDTSSYQYYLRHDFYCASNKYGTPFLQYNCDAVELSTNTIIYGHNMTDGLMFADLENYLTLEGYADSPIITYNTLYETYYFKVFAVMITNGSADGDNGYLFYYPTATFATEENYSLFLDAIMERSLYITEVDVTTEDKIITLSTCGYDFDDERIVVFGRLLRDGESLEVDTSAAVENDNVRYPQIYYDTYGLTNPWKDAYQWTTSSGV